MSRQRNSPDAKPVPFSVKLDRELRDRLNERAKAEHRSASQHVRWLIERDAPEKEAA